MKLFKISATLYKMKLFLMGSVLKEDFEEFNKDYLTSLAKGYLVFFADKPGNRLAYDYNLLKNRLSF